MFGLFRKKRPDPIVLPVINALSKHIQAVVLFDGPGCIVMPGIIGNFISANFKDMEIGFKVLQCEGHEKVKELVTIGDINKAVKAVDSGFDSYVLQIGPLPILVQKSTALPPDNAFIDDACQRLVHQDWKANRSAYQHSFVVSPLFPIEPGRLALRATWAVLYVATALAHFVRANAKDRVSDVYFMNSQLLIRGQMLAKLLCNRDGHAIPNLIATRLVWPSNPSLPKVARVAGIATYIGKEVELPDFCEDEVENWLKQHRVVEYLMDKAEPPGEVIDLPSYGIKLSLAERKMDGETEILRYVQA